MRNHRTRWCSAMAAALALALVPIPARARMAPPSETVQPTETPPEMQPEAITPPPLTPPPEPEPPAEPIPPPTPTPGPTPMPPPAPMPFVPGPPVIVEGPAPAVQGKYERMRKGGIGLMYSGGLVATTGFGLVLAYTIVGDQHQRREMPIVVEIERSDELARIGGALLASGLAVVAIGGIVFARANRVPAASGAEARVRVLPGLGGVVVAGEF